MANLCDEGTHRSTTGCSLHVTHMILNKLNDQMNADIHTAVIQCNDVPLAAMADLKEI